MGGWNHNKSKEYQINRYFVSEDELWALFNYFFSPACKKTSTYKFGFMKSIFDTLFSGELNEKGYEISFDVLFEHFAMNYWNLISVYHLKQLRYNGSSISSLERVIINAISSKDIISKLEFDSLNNEDRDSIIQEVKKNCIGNVVGAIYEDFEGVLYGYNPKGNGIWINPVAYEFLLKHKFELEKLNYYEWARKLEQINSESQPTEILDKLEKSTPERKDLSFYRNILQDEFEEHNCFYCGKKLEKDLTVDHIVPWKLVREDRIWNFVLSCKSCNSKKNDRVPDKRKLLLVLDRNEMICKSNNERVIQECKGYSAEMMLRLWNYAKIGGYREYNQ